MTAYMLQDVVMSHLPSMQSYSFSSELSSALQTMYVAMEYDHTVPAQYTYVSPIVSTTVSSGSGGAGTGGGGGGWNTVGAGRHGGSGSGGGRGNGRMYGDRDRGYSSGMASAVASAPTPVQVAKQKQGSSATALKLLLNKLSTKTEATISRKVMDEIDQHCTDVAYQQEVCPILVSFLSSNQFYAGLFAKLYVQLCNRYAWFREYHMQRVTLEFAQRAETVDASSAETQSAYDALCSHNKRCDEKKAMITFFCHLFFLSSIRETNVVGGGSGDGDVDGAVYDPELMHWFGKWVADLVAGVYAKREGNNVSETEEWVEWMFIVFTSVSANEYREYVRNVRVCVQQHDNVNEEMSVVEVVSQLSKTTAKECRGWSNKAMFKCLDIMDAVRKW